MTLGRNLIAGSAIASLALAGPAHGQSARLGGLQDVSFGSITAATDQTIAQSVVVCSYRNNPHALPYSLTATGSGTGGAFTLASGASLLPFDVQWADSAAQTSGTMIEPGAVYSGFGNGATGFACPQQPDTASLIVTVRATDLASANAGTYSGSLQITIAPQ